MSVSRKTRESWEQQTQAGLAAVPAQLRSMDPSDQAAIVQVGSALEQVFCLVEEHASQVAAPLKLALRALEGLYQRQVARPAELLTAIACSVDALLAGLELEETPGRWQGLADVAKPVQALLDEPLPASGASAQPGPNDVSLDDIAARLVGISTSDQAALQDVAGLLRGFIARADVSGPLHVAGTMALEHVQEIISGKSPNGEATLAAVCKALSGAEAPVAQPAPVAARPPVAAAPAPTPPASEPAVRTLNDTLPVDADLALLKEYVVESLDHIAAAKASLLELETNASNPEPIGTIFRAFHTIKGTSGFLGLERIQRTAHLAENLLDRARSNQIRMVGGCADLALESCDALKFMIAALPNLVGGDSLPYPDNSEALLEKLGNPEDVGIGEDLVVTPMRIGDILVGQGQATREMVEQAVASKGTKPLGQKLIEQGQAGAAEVAKALRTQKQMAGGEGSTPSDSTVRVNIGRLDNLVDMVGELVIAQSMVAQDPEVTDGARPRLCRNVGHVGKIVRELQDLSMSLRMVPLKPTFQKMARLVRDLAHKSNKSIRFETTGDDTEIDRNMVEALNDPLVHMIRNAVDHGVESPQLREQQGKNPTGTLELRAYQSAGSVVIEICDDGHGLDRAKILAKAANQGLVEPGRELSDSDVFGLIFRPGFSTAEKVTDISGRGVGMDVVKRNVEMLRGPIEVTSKPGEGSRFILRLPLTMAITDAMMVRTGSERYLMPTIAIEQSFRPQRGTVCGVLGQGEVVMLRGQSIPVFRLYDLFSIGQAIKDPHEGLLIVIEGEGQRCALMVDELLGQQQVVSKSLGRSFKPVPGIAGAAILGDGRVGLIIDVAGIIRLAHEKATRGVAA